MLALEVMTPATALEDAVVRAVLYADIFDWPLTREEIFTFLDHPAATQEEVDVAVDRVLGRWAGIEAHGEFIHRVGRAGVVAARRAQSSLLDIRWKRARRYGRLMWSLPFVRMVAVTGTLAADVAAPEDDIDFLLITEPGRLWMARGMVILLCKLARLSGGVLCPNYILSLDALRLDRQDFYTARELAQMVPLYGRGVARRFRRENCWSLCYLPNAHGTALTGVPDRLPQPFRLLKALAERLLRLPPGNLIERWERERKITQLSREVPAHVRETRFNADVCKGHRHGHGARIMRLFHARLAGTEIDEVVEDAPGQQPVALSDRVSAREG